MTFSIASPSAKIYNAFEKLLQLTLKHANAKVDTYITNFENITKLTSLAMLYHGNNVNYVHHALVQTGII